MIIVAILVFSAFAVSFGWYYYAKQSIKELVGLEEKKPEEAQVEKEIAPKQEASKKVVLKIGERAAYRRPSGARIIADVQSISSYEGDAEVYAELFYRNRPVANNSYVIKSISPGEKMSVTIVILYYDTWSAFDVRQV